MVEINEALSAARNDAVTPNDIRMAMRDINRIYEHLKAFERKELMRLILALAQVNERQIVLDIDS